MVTPIYDYEGALASSADTHPRGRSRSHSRETVFTHGYGSSPSHHVHDSLHRTYQSSSRSPSYYSYPPDEHPYGRPSSHAYSYADSDRYSRSRTPYRSRSYSHHRRSRSYSRPRHRYRSPSTPSSSSDDGTGPRRRAVYTDSDYSDRERERERPRYASYSPSRRRRRSYSRSLSRERYQSGSYNEDYSHRYSSYPSHSRSRARTPIERSRPSNDPLVQHPPDYQVQATQGPHGSQGVPMSSHSHQPSHQPSYQASQHSAPHHQSQHFPSQHAPSSSHRPNIHSADYAYGQPQLQPSYQGSHHGSASGSAYGHGGGGHLGRPPTSASIHAGRAPFYPPSGGGGIGSVMSAIHSITHSRSHEQGHGSTGGGHPASAPGRPSSILSNSNSSNSRFGGDLRGMTIDRGFFDEAVRRYCQLIPPAPDFCLSRCVGKKKAVCIGINYIGERDELRGCANDARDMRDFLIRMYHFPPDQILLITDDGPSGSPRPTRKEMFNAMNWLVRGAAKDDSLFFHYSGHGGQSDDASGREADGKDEVIFPLDYDKSGDIIDDELHQALVHTLPTGCRLTAIFDSCHSGTVLDLPYLHSAHGRLRSIGHISKRARARGVAPSADVICFAACKDDETSADTFNGGVATGAMSYAFVESLKENQHQTYEELLAHLRHILIPKYHQKAQISGTHPVDMSRQFTL